MWWCWPKKTNQKSLGARPARPKGWGHPTELNFPSNCTSDQRGVSCNNYTDPKSSLANSVEEEKKNRTKTTWFVNSRMFSSESVFISLVFISHHVLRLLLNITVWLVSLGFCIMCWKSDDESAYSKVGVMVPRSAFKLLAILGSLLLRVESPTADLFLSFVVSFLQMSDLLKW